MTHSNTTTDQPGHHGDQVRPLDLDTVVTVLYIGVLDPIDWHLMGPGRVAHFVRTVAADPRFRVPEMVALVGEARRLGPPFVLPDHLADCLDYAPAVLAAAAR